MKFRLWLETKEFSGLKPSDIEWWANYSVNKIFSTPEEAREWLFSRREFADRQSHAKVFGIDGPEYNRAYANSMPVYQSGKSWKIGKRIRKKPFSWDDVEIVKNNLEDLQANGTVNMFDGPKLGPVQLVPLRKLRKMETHSEKPAGQAKIHYIVNQIKNGTGYFKAIVYNDLSSIIDGHHRYEVARMLKMTKVPAQQITYPEEE